MLSERRAKFLLTAAGVPDPSPDEVDAVSAVAWIREWEFARFVAATIAEARSGDGESSTST